MTCLSFKTILGKVRNHCGKVKKENAAPLSQVMFECDEPNGQMKHLCGCNPN